MSSRRLAAVLLIIRSQRCSEFSMADRNEETACGMFDLAHKAK